MADVDKAFQMIILKEEMKFARQFSTPPKFELFEE
jgi:hypothetical protein